jgi:hypothetical protein
MPLAPGSSEEVIGENIAELRHSGHPEKQSIAIALEKARQTDQNLINTMGGHVMDRQQEDAARRRHSDAAAQEHLARHGGRADETLDNTLKHNKETAPDTGLDGPAQGSIYKRFR